jgi:propionyl-CoA carboxylase beta chain
MENAREYLQSLREKANLGGGKERIAQQHKRGKLTARERIDLLVDAGSFVELDAFVQHECVDAGLDPILGDGVVTGFATISGDLVYLFSQDFTVYGGSLGAAFAKKICKVMDLALQNKAPLIGLNDSGGARIQEGVASLGGYADIFYRNVKASGKIPQISLVLGPCAGGAVYSPAMTDFIFMVDQKSHMFITGPDVIKTVTQEEISFEDLGGSETHAQKSGVIDARFASEIEMFTACKRLLDYLQKPVLPAEEARAKNVAIESIVPDNPNQPYDVKAVIDAVVDEDSFFEFKPEYAANITIGLARLGGRSVGIVANNPQYLAGVLDIESSCKGARFVRFCDAFDIPIVTFVDVPGFLPGSDQEHAGIIRHGAKLLYAFCEAEVPKLTVILRKAYGGAYDVMSSKHIGADLNLAWPRAEIAVMGAQGACQIIYRKEISAASDSAAKAKELSDQYAAKFATPYEAAKKGYIDAVIFPQETRDMLIKGLKSCERKLESRQKNHHGNIPL